MPSTVQYLALSEFVRAAQSWWNDEHTLNGRALGQAIELAEGWLRPLLAAQVAERLFTGQEDTANRSRINEMVDEILAEVSYAAVKDFARLNGATGKEFYHWLAKMADCRLRDLERRRHARRKRGADNVQSLDGDAAAAKLAALLEDASPSPEAVALFKELKGELRRAMKGLSTDERRVVTLVERGVPMSQIVATFGESAREHWRTAKAHLRRLLDDGPRVRCRRKPK